MPSLNESIREYTAQLQLGQIQIAYKGIMTLMSGFKTFLESRHPDYAVSGLYFGYMDMTYFAFTPLDLKQRSLKIAIVYLHEQNRFEIWLGGANRKVQAEYIKALKGTDIGCLRLSEVTPGVDSILEMEISEQPDFDHPQALIQAIENKLLEFAEKVKKLL